jgi:hypothetical protein
MRYILCFLYALTSAMGGAAFAASPAAESPGLTNLQQMVNNLGYNTTLSPDGKDIKFQWQSSNYTYMVHLSLTQDQTLAYAYVDLLTYSPTQLAKLDYAKLLEASDTGDFYFSMEKGQDGKSEELYVNSVVPIDGLTPEALRLLLQGMADKIDDSGKAWDPTLWK